MTHRLLIACATLVAALLAGCSSPGTRVVLLPQPDGSPSAVVVRTKGGEQLISQPYQRATALVNKTANAPTVDSVDAAKVRTDNKELFDLAPPKAQSFDLYFDAGGTTLTSDSQRALDNVLSTAVSRTGADITVTGHTDTTGTADQNDALSLRRAQQIRLLLVNRGFPAQRVEAIGRGQRELAVPTGPDVDEPRNRRVVIVVR
ncbi:OmpA family protein [Variovorax sp. J22R133]|uniref:OmpA family protein n=1 Tax=Variovorax brevis TaxID=3053503 RepID=UPI002576301D|nr:OmpA family protein [Variovorax sp. J22R133]MDM0114898.1 OmpA family protein [Variovorax sp. J22R133]